jgi:Tol biopolymer transport system component
VAFTRQESDGGVTAVAVRHDKPAEGATPLSEAAGGASRFPRWSADGNSVAFVEEVAGAQSLVTRTVPLAAGQSTSLASAAAAGVTAFFHLEWAPSSLVAFTRSSGSARSGISVVPGAGGEVRSVSPVGAFPSWSRAGDVLAFSAGGAGLRTVRADGTALGEVPGTASTDVQPVFSPVGDLLLFLRSGGNEVTLDSDATPTALEELLVQPSAGGPATSVAARVEEPVAGGALGSFVALPAWHPSGGLVAYVRLSYFRPAVGTAQRCGETVLGCGGRAFNELFVRRLNPTTGAPEGEEVRVAQNATLPAFSPDGAFLAWVSGPRLAVQRIDPVTGAVQGTAVTHTFSGIQTREGDDSRPRWQPR